MCAVNVTSMSDGEESMDALPCGDLPVARLVDIIELKWLLARDGVHLHVERLQNDGDYAHACLAAACRSPSAAVRRVAERIGHQLGLDFGLA